MSHFITLVFTKENGRTVEELLAPYDENIVYAPYVLYTREQAIAKIRKEIEDYKNGPYAEYVSSPKKYEESHPNAEHINYLKNKFPKKLEWTDDECYQDMKGRFDEDMIKLNGDLLSTYNPNSKWDWYTIGGRWNNYLKTLSGETTNEDYASKIDWKDIIPFAFVTPIGEWHERGEMVKHYIGDNGIFNINVYEVYSTQIPVKANSYEEAVKKVEEMYKKKEIILELDDLTEYKIS